MILRGAGAGLRLTVPPLTDQTPLQVYMYMQIANEVSPVIGICDV